MGSDERVDELIAALSLDEQIRLLAGRDYWHTEPIERLGISSMHLSDGPVGVRGARSVGSTSISFPAGVAIGATFDPTAAAELADALADECLDKGVHVLLGPTINLQRHPLGGRHFECYSEDPVLTSELAVAYVAALQARGIAATIKHFVANDTEHERHTISSEVDDEVLERCYLAPFEDAVRIGGAWAVMAAYNRVNGTYAAEHEVLLRAVLRERWGYDGLVMSDWFGAKSTAASANAGLDLEMPGPPLHYGDRLAEAVSVGQVSPEVVAERARRVLQLAARVGALGLTERPAPRRSVGERRELARQLATRSFVLLRNEPADSGPPLLPLTLAPGSLLGVVGPNAARTSAQGGGSARVTPERTISILDGLRAAFGPLGVEVEHEIGCVTYSETPEVDLPSQLEYFALPEDAAADPRAAYAGPVLYAERSPGPPLVWLGEPVPGVTAVPPGRFAVRWSADLVAQESGTHHFSLAQVGTARLFIDGVQVLEGSSERGRRFFQMGSAEVSAAVDLVKGATYRLVAEYEVMPGLPIGGLFVGLRPPLPDDDELIRRAVDLAARADAVVCVVGTTAEWETEGRDRRSMDLPGRQDELVRAVAAANPRTAVLVNAGSPVTMDWHDQPAAVMQVWFGGQEVGAAVAAVLSGVEEPGGRLPHTVPARLEDTPAYPYYPGTDGRAPYGEGLLVGHRHYATAGVAPRFWFGEGRGYTTWSFDEATTARNEDGWKVVTTVTNTGPRVGSCVLQAYLAPEGGQPAHGEPALQFAGSVRATMPPGESSQVEIELPSYRLGRVRPGAYDVLVGWSADPDGLASAGKITVVQ
ncbi:MAG TPA: glycoside hydrolase family 3 C-terminal domain-containing protein [Acidimicrobiales bacterium]|nr:glycoside hydrolase family 3 C-terminal domain-containing protein [Acidimicrobiales bacterium]